MFTTPGNAAMEATIARALGQQHQEQVDAYRQMQRTIGRALGGQPDPTATIRRCIGSDLPYEPPRAEATSRDTLTLFVPLSSFDGSWDGFQRARDAAIKWVQGNRSQIVNGSLCCGTGFALDDKPIAYKENGKLWINCSIREESAYWQARYAGGVVYKLAFGIKIGL